jgi:hypothetical protein
MLKKIALVGIFALVSVVSFNASSASPSGPQTTSIQGPTMKGLNPCGNISGKCGVR